MAAMNPAAAVKLRLANRSDAGAIAEIYNEAIATTTATFDVESRSAEDRAAWLETHDERHPVFVAEVDGVVVGWACLSAWSDRTAYAGTGEVTYYVLSQYRGRGIGRHLQEALIAHAKAHGFHTLIERITAGNDASVRLCEAAGFERVGTMKEVGFKFGELLDVHVLQKMLNKRSG
jgi:phosphinothricin acetyltransferase